MADQFTFLVVVHVSGQTYSSAVTDAGNTPIGDIASRVVATLGLQLDFSMVLLHGDVRIPPDRLVRRIFADAEPDELTIHVVLVPWLVNLPAVPELPEDEDEEFDDEDVEFDEDEDEDVDLADEIELRPGDTGYDLSNPTSESAPVARDDEFPTQEVSPAPSAPPVGPAPAARPSLPPADWSAESLPPPASRSRALPRVATQSEVERVVSRRATVRYYNRMNPEKVFPLLVILSEERIKEIIQKRVEQKETGPFEVTKDSFVEVEPILPGCTCYPSMAVLKIGSGVDTLPFWVVPHVMGKVKGARVEVRQDGKQLGSIELNIKVRRQTMAVVFSLFTLAMPLLSGLAQHFQIDFTSQKAQGFALYFQAWDFLLKQLSPVTLAAALAVVTAGFYLWARPRRRDQFWDVEAAR